jgi:hypothetical protein
VADITEVTDRLVDAVPVMPMEEGVDVPVEEDVVLVGAGL